MELKWGETTRLNLFLKSIFCKKIIPEIANHTQFLPVFGRTTFMNSSNLFSHYAKWGFNYFKWPSDFVGSSFISTHGAAARFQQSLFRFLLIIAFDSRSCCSLSMIYGSNCLCASLKLHSFITFESSIESFRILCSLHAFRWECEQTYTQSHSHPNFIPLKWIGFGRVLRYKHVLCVRTRTSNCYIWYFSFRIVEISLQRTHTHTQTDRPFGKFE